VFVTIILGSLLLARNDWLKPPSHCCFRAESHAMFKLQRALRRLDRPLPVGVRRWVWCSQLRQNASVVEVEVKFRYQPEQEREIASIARFVEEKSFEDTYYDIRPKYPLTRNDIWLRKRGESFECKVPPELSGRSQLQHVDQYEELTQEKAICDFLRRLPP